MLFWLVVVVGDVVVFEVFVEYMVVVFGGSVDCF